MAIIVKELIVKTRILDDSKEPVSYQVRNDIIQESVEQVLEIIKLNGEDGR